MSVWYVNRPQHVFYVTCFLCSVLGVVFVRLVNPPMLCGFSYFEVLKFPNSAMRISNVGVSAHCMLSARLFISHSAKVAKTSKFRELWCQHTISHTINRQVI